MLESKMQAILAGQNQTIGFDSDVGDAGVAKSSTDTEFSAELSRAKESITDDKLSRDTQNGSTVASSQANANSSVDSGNSSTVERQPATSESTIKNQAGSTAEKPENSPHKNSLINGGDNTSVDRNATLNSVQGTPVSDNSNLTLPVDPDGEPQLVPSLLADSNFAGNKPQVSGDVPGVQQKVTTFTGPAAAAMTGRDSLPNSAAGEQYDQELVGSKYANNTHAVVQKLHDDPYANQAQSTGAPVQADPTKRLGDSVLPAAISGRTGLSATTQKTESSLSTRNLHTDAGEVVDSSASASLSSKAGTADLLAISNNIAATANPNNDAQVTPAIASRKGLDTLSNADASRTSETANRPVSPTAGIGISNVNGVQASSLTTTPSVSSGDTQPSSASVSTSPNTNTLAQNTLTGHEFLRSIANTRTEAQVSHGNNAALNANTNLTENSVAPSVSLTGKVVSQAGMTGTTPQSTAVDATLPVNTGQASAIKIDGSDALAMSTLSASKGVLADNFSGTNGDSTGAQHNYQQAAAKLDVSADKAVTNIPAFNVALNQNKEANVTPANQMKQLLGVKEQPDMTGLQAVKGAIDTPSSNVYHVTTNGIITANSSSLNAAPLSDLASAPRTVMLNQPDADQSLVENLRWAVNEKLSRVTVNVSPANLGPISVSVDVENQNMSVSIITNNVVAKEAIDSILPRMREHFSSEGYQQVSVDVSSQQERNSNLRNQTAEFLNNQNDSGSESHNADQQNADSSQFDTDSEQSLFISKHRSSSQSLIDTYA